MFRLSVVKHIEDALPYQYDYVLLCTKAVPELHTAADTLEPLLNKYAHPQPTYVILQNGLGIEKELYAALQAKEHPSSILSCAVYVMANVLDNGDVLHVNSVWLPYNSCGNIEADCFLGQGCSWHLQTPTQPLDQ